MTLKTPAFWYRKNGSPAPLAERMLAPVSCLYALGRRAHLKFRPAPYKAEIPVLCVGNAVAGGSGKTPAALALMDVIRKAGLARNPYFLSRGYGGRVKGPAIVDPLMSAGECGDEPLLLAASSPVVIAASRPEGARFCAEHGADLALMDDGLQNPALHKDLGFLVIDGAAGFGNGRLLPAGPLRERLEEAFDRADAFILIGKDSRNVTALLPPGKPLFHAHIKPSLSPALTNVKKPVIAFAGIGRPEKFYQMLTALGVDVAGWHPFPDHYRYTAHDLERLKAEAQAGDAALLTTEKDAVRLRGMGIEADILTVPIRLEFENPQAVLDFLASRLKV